MSIRRPSASSRSSIRQRNACVRTRAPGYHLNGTETRSASWPRARSSSTSSSVKISAPPRAKGTCGRRTAIRMCLAVLRGAELRQLALELRDALLQVVDQAERGGVEGPLVVGERLDVPAHHLLEDGLDGRAEPTPDAGPEAERAVGRHRPEALGLGARRAAVVRLPGRPGVGPGATDLLPERC